MSKKHIIVFVFISILLVSSLVLSGVLFYQKQQDKLWVVAINEDGVYIEGGKHLPFKYSYINEKNKTYIFSTSESIEEVVSTTPSIKPD